MHRKHSSELKVKVALEALRGQLTTAEIASRFEVHPCQVSQWKRQALEALPRAFGQDQGRAAREQEELTDNLYQEIGRLKMELDWLQKKGANYRLSRNGR
jgi:transposase-like protein